MVEIISKNKTHTVIKLANRLMPSFELSNRTFKGKEYVEDLEEKKEISKIRKEFELGKYITLKEFLLEN